MWRTSTSQRHTYISGIVAGGASVKTAQELARHSTPVLTIGRYSHARLHDLQGALDALPDLQPQDPTPQTTAYAMATGTDGESAEVLRGQMRGQYGRKTLQEVANCGERPEDCGGDGDTPQVLSMADFAILRETLRQWSGAGSNRRHSDFQSDALPTELPDPTTCSLPMTCCMPDRKS